jgi:adenylate cyclase
LATATVTRISVEHREEDDRTIAELALQGERAACAARVAMMMLLGLANALAPLFGDPGLADPIQLAGVVAYLTFTVGFWLGLRRSKPSIRAGRIAPFIFMAVDFSWPVFITWRASVVGSTRYPWVGALLLAMYVCFNVARHSRWHAIVSTLAATLTFVLIMGMQGTLPPRGIMMAVALYPIIGGLIIWANSRVRATWIDVRRRENLAHFLPRQVVDRVLRAGGKSLEPVQREVTLMFSDIRDFTSISEKLPPKEVLEFLDDYFGHMSQIVKGHQGMLNKFIGDGLMAVWGVPDFSEEHAVLAIRAALDMRTKLAELNQHRVKQQGKEPIRIGIGIHTGPVAAGMLGGADQHEYTVIGDAVNLASRIEGLTKQSGADILISERTLALSKDRFEVRRVGEEKVKGRAEPVIVYAVIGPKPAA